jgi:hypothetical protein
MNQNLMWLHKIYEIQGTKLRCFEQGSSMCLKLWPLNKLHLICVKPLLNGNHSLNI